MSDLDHVGRLVTADQGLAIVSIARADGSIHTSLVNAGVVGDVETEEDVVAFVVRGNSFKARRLRSHPRATVTFRAGWDWAAVEGGVRLIGPDDPVDGVDVVQLLRDIFLAAGGDHDDWDEYDRVMAQERRAAVLVDVERISSNPS